MKKNHTARVLDALAMKIQESEHPDPLLVAEFRQLLNQAPDVKQMERAYETISQRIKNLEEEHHRLDQILRANGILYPVEPEVAGA